MDRRELCRLLQLTLRQYEVSAIPPSLDSVQAVTFERLSGMPVREMVILGGREGLFPPEKASMSLFSENERVALETEGIELTQNALERVWQQQCALCRALAYGGDILLLDEPLKGLDADTRDRVVELLRRECADKTLLLVTHDPRESEALCDSVLTYQDGIFA